MTEKMPLAKVDVLKPGYGWSTLFSHQPKSVRSSMSHGSCSTVVAKSFADATVPAPLRLTVIWADTEPAVPASTRVQSNSVRFMVPRKGSSFRKRLGRARCEGGRKPVRLERAGESSIADTEWGRQRE